MCNCGNKRNEYIAQEVLSSNNDVAFEETIPVTQYSKDCYFEYIGKTGLTVVGNNTGNYYRFYAPGQVQLISFSDVDGMLKIPILKMVNE